MVEALATKTLSWESERGTVFVYDGVRLLSMLEEYMIVRQERVEEKKRQREMKKLQGQFITEQEAIFGSKPSPSKTGKKAGGGNNRRLSVVGHMIQTPRPISSQSTRATPNSRPVKKLNNPETKDRARRTLDVANLPARNNYTINGRESEPASVRRPFSHVSSTASVRATEELHDDQNIIQKNSFENITPQKIVLKSNSILTTPSRVIYAVDEENRTPNEKSIPVPVTPLTVSTPMQIAMTPAPLSVYGGSPVEERRDEIEYSFEERRVDFIVPNSYSKTTIRPRPSAQPHDGSASH